jgi:hypothetical protein
MKTNSPFKYTSKQAAESDRTFSKSLNQTKDFKALKSDWDRRLSQSGFKDAEKPSGELRSPDLRTIAWQNRDAIRDFFLALDTYLSTNPDMTPAHRVILEAYSQGTHVKDIVKTSGLSHTTVFSIIRRYKTLILGTY